MFADFPRTCIFTPVSHPASDEIIPPNILNMAKLMVLNLGICDHNSAKNIKAMLQRAKARDCNYSGEAKQKNTCFATRQLDKVLKFQEFVYNHLPSP